MITIFKTNIISFILIFILSSLTFAENGITVTINSKKDLKKLKVISFIPPKTTGIFTLSKTVQTDSSGATYKYLYQVKVDTVTKWEVLLPQQNNDLDKIIKNNSVQNIKTTPKQEEAASSKRHKDRENLTNYGIDYHVTPWKSIKPFYKTDSLKEKLKSLFQWKSGGEFELTRHSMYNFSIYSNNSTVNLTKPAISDITFDLSYSYNWRFLWFGGGISRSNQTSTYFDSVDTKNQNWFGRMGWKVNIAVPGFKYELFRDPALIATFGRYDREVFKSIVPNRTFEILNVLNMNEKDVYDTVLSPIDTVQYTSGNLDTTIVIYDTLIVKYNLERFATPAQRFSFKVGILNYILTIDPTRYLGPIQEIMLSDMPFFRGTWDLGLIILPSGRVMPTGSVIFHTFKIPLSKSSKYQFEISPVKFTFQLTSQKEFYIAFGFKTDFRMRN